MKFFSVVTALALVATVSAGKKKKNRDRSTAGKDDCYNCGNKNPCDPLETDGLFYYPRCNKPEKFVQCSEYGECFVRPCAPGTVWDQRVLTCVEEIVPGECYSCEENNPCSPLAVPDKYYYSGCKKKEYVQCSAHGQCFDMKCPSGTMWDDGVLSCVAK